MISRKTSRRSGCPLFPYCPSENGACGSNNGNVVSQKLTVPKSAGGTLVLATGYGYDLVNRLTAAVEHSDSLAGSATWTQNFGYTDGSGNYGQYGNPRVTGDEIVPSELTCGTYDANTNRCADSGFTYDGAGNPLAFPNGRSATYDAENRQVTLKDSGTSQYAYDGEGRRVTKTIGGQTVVYVYDARGQLAAEYGGTPDPTGCATCYLTVDHLGSTRLVTDGSGNVKRRYDYLPFGYEINSSWGQRTTVTGYQSDIFNPKFTGKPRDYESTLGLDYFGARYYSAAQGRFTSPDEPLIDQFPSDPQSWNLYGYVRNNPLINVDLSGRDCIYTNNYNSDGTVAVSNEQGGCSGSGGTYVPGTVDIGAVNVNGNSGLLNYAYTPYDSNGNYTFSSLALPDPGIEALQRGVFMAEPGVNLAAEGLRLGASIAFPLPTLAAELMIGVDSKVNAAQAAISRKPGSLGQFKSADALRQENKVARDIIKQLHLTGKDAEVVHELISEASIHAGRKLGFRELVAYVKAVLGLL